MTRMRTLFAMSIVFFLAGAAGAFEAEIGSLPTFGAGNLTAASPFITAEVTSDFGISPATVTATDGTNTFPVTSLGAVSSTTPSGLVELFSIDVSSACPGSFVVNFSAGNTALATSTSSHLVICN